MRKKFFFVSEENATLEKMQQQKRSLVKEEIHQYSNSNFYEIP